MTAPYRDDFDALSARHAALTEELLAIRSRTREIAELQQEEAKLAGEVSALQKKLDGMSSRRSLPILESVRIASPCTASWEEMTGDERVRFCGHCAKDVYNLSGMTREESEQLLRERAGDICVRIYKRDDGTVLTADCPVGVKRKRRRRIAAAAVSGGLAAAGALLFQATRPPSVEGTRHEGSAAPQPTETAWVMGTAAPEVPPPPPPERTAKSPPSTSVRMGAVARPMPSVKPPRSSR